MNSPYKLIATAGFQEDIERLEQHIVDRELASHAPDDACLFRFRDAVVRSLQVLTLAPHTCRRSEQDRSFRELIIPFGSSGCVALFVIRGCDVLLLAVRHQHESDYR